MDLHYYSCSRHIVYSSCLVSSYEETCIHDSPLSISCWLFLILKQRLSSLINVFDVASHVAPPSLIGTYKFVQRPIYSDQNRLAVQITRIPECRFRKLFKSWELTEPWIDYNRHLDTFKINHLERCSIKLSCYNQSVRAFKAVPSCWRLNLTRKLEVFRLKMPPLMIS